MKKKMITTVIAIAVMVVVLMPTTLGPFIDKYNPLYKTKEYYTIVNTIGQPVGDEWYEYEFIAFDERGKEQKIKKTVKHMLKRDEALRVLAKGRYGESIEEIEITNIPINAKSKLLATR
ncbi:TPA: YxeA family protein [Bacillus luti]|nr:YxeA family protein [Bacillus luti]